jgi:Domain of unknown function (DUF4440)
MSEQQALEDAARREVLELEAKIYADPMSRHNVGALLAPEFWDVSPAGEKVSRETMLERLATNPVIVDEYPVDDTRVDLYGDVAISTGRAVLRGRVVQEGGQEKQIERASRFVHVWVRNNGVWQTVYAQSSPATAG